MKFRRFFLTNLFYLLTSRTFYIFLLLFFSQLQFHILQFLLFLCLLFLVYFFPTEFWYYIFQLIFLYLFFIPWQKLFNFLLTLVSFSSLCLAIISYKLAIQTFFSSGLQGKNKSELWERRLIHSCPFYFYAVAETGFHLTKFWGLTKSMSNNNTDAYRNKLFGLQCFIGLKSIVIPLCSHPASGAGVRGGGHRLVSAVLPALLRHNRQEPRPG